MNVQMTALLNNILIFIVNPTIKLMVAVAVIVFIYGVFQFIRNAESSDGRKKGGLNIMWGVIGLFIMISAYGILNVVIDTIR